MFQPDAGPRVHHARALELRRPHRNHIATLLRRQQAVDAADARRLAVHRHRRSPQARFQIQLQSAIAVACHRRVRQGRHCRDARFRRQCQQRSKLVTDIADQFPVADAFGQQCGADPVAFTCCLRQQCFGLPHRRDVVALATEIHRQCPQCRHHLILRRRDQAMAGGREVPFHRDVTQRHHRQQITGAAVPGTLGPQQPVHRGCDIQLGADPIQQHARQPDLRTRVVAFRRDGENTMRFLDLFARDQRRRQPEQRVRRATGRIAQQRVEGRVGCGRHRQRLTDANPAQEEPTPRRRPETPRVTIAIACLVRKRP